MTPFHPICRLATHPDHKSTPALGLHLEIKSGELPDLTRLDPIGAGRGPWDSRGRSRVASGAGRETNGSRVLDFHSFLPITSGRWTGAVRGADMGVVPGRLGSV
jgi:hypothetical protein